MEVGGPYFENCWWPRWRAIMQHYNPGAKIPTMKEIEAKTSSGRSYDEGLSRDLVGGDEVVEHL